jgi:hypothetical protein
VPSSGRERDVRVRELVGDDGEVHAVRVRDHSQAVGVQAVSTG